MYYDDSYEDDYEQYEEECEWYEEELPSCSTSYNFMRNEGYTYDPMYYEDVCAKPPRDTPMNELEILRATCKTFPQQYQTYLVVMGESHKTTPFGYFFEWVFGYRPNSVDVNSLRNNQQSTSLEEHERIKNQPTCEKSSEISFSMDEEMINKFVDLMWRGWKKFRPKEGEKSQDKQLKEESETHKMEHESPQGDCRE